MAEAQKEKEQMRIGEAQEELRRIKSKIDFLVTVATAMVDSQNVQMRGEAANGLAWVLDDIEDELDKIADAELVSGV